MENAAEPTQTHRRPLKWIVVALIIVALFVAIRFLPTARWFDSLDHWVIGLGPLGMVVYGAVYVLAAILFIPGSVLTLGAGLIFGLFWGTVVVSIGSTLAAAAAFLIARYFARAKVETMARNHPRFQAIDGAIGQRGWKIVALLRLSPAVPYSLSNYFYGLTAVRFWPYVLASWLAMLPGTILYVYLGVAGKATLTAAAAGGDAQRNPLQSAYLIIGLVATIAVTVYLTRVARSALADVADDTDPAPPPSSPDAETPNDRPGGGHKHAKLAVTLAALLLIGAVVTQADGGLLKRLFGPKQVTLAEAYKPRPDGPTFDHAKLDALLKKHVDKDGWVDYQGLRKDPSQLDAYIAALAEAPFDQLGRNEKLALLINAYNAFTLRLILDHWPLKSIKDIPKAKRWDDARWKIDRLTLSLSRIEHEYLRAKFRDPRIHFAVNCASVGCPPLRPEAYVASRIEDQLQTQAEYVHRHDRWFRFDADKRVVYLTKLYDWYQGDFTQAADSVLAYAARFTPALDADSSTLKNLTVKYLDYNWSLNTARP